MTRQQDTQQQDKYYDDKIVHTTEGAAILTFF